MTASEHRTRAREALRNNWGWAILTSLVASLLGGISSPGFAGEDTQKPPGNGNRISITGRYLLGY